MTPIYYCETKEFRQVPLSQKENSYVSMVVYRPQVLKPVRVFRI